MGKSAEKLPGLVEGYGLLWKFMQRYIDILWIIFFDIFKWNFKAKLNQTDVTAREMLNSKMREKEKKYVVTYSWGRQIKYWIWKDRKMNIRGSALQSG